MWGGYYEPGSLIWVNRWTTDTAIIECCDALAYPGDLGRAVLLRRIIAREGDAKVAIVLDPRSHFGKTAPTQVRLDGDVWTARSGEVRL